MFQEKQTTPWWKFEHQCVLEENLWDILRELQNWEFLLWGIQKSFIWPLNCSQNLLFSNGDRKSLRKVLLVEQWQRKHPCISLILMVAALSPGSMLSGFLGSFQGFAWYIDFYLTLRVHIFLWSNNYGSKISHRKLSSYSIAFPVENNRYSGNILWGDPAWGLQGVYRVCPWLTEERHSSGWNTKTQIFNSLDSRIR